MQINEETRNRIIAAADQLFNESGRSNFPTVDAVRRVSKTNMNDASAVMKDWRKMQTATAEPVAQVVPDRVQKASAAALAAMWHEAQEIANENLKNVQAARDTERDEAEALRNELSTAFENQALELAAAIETLDTLDKASTAAAKEAAAKLDQVQTRLTAMTEQASTAETRLVEVEKRADDLKAALSSAQEIGKTVAAELNAERKRLEVAESDRDTARIEASSAREEAAKLAGQVEAMQKQATELMRAIAARQVPEDGAVNLATKTTRAKKP